MPNPDKQCRRLALAAFMVVLLAACSKVDDPGIAVRHTPDLAPPELSASSFNPQRNLYWGDLHIHTSLSFDAYTFGVRTLPDDAWRYMKGETIEHGGGYTIRAKRPLDFGAVTEHAEYLGIARHLEGDDVENNPFQQVLQSGSPLAMTWHFFKTTLSKMGSAEARNESFNRPELQHVSRAAWQQVIGDAERNNQPGRFTAFIGYEWTSMPEAQNLHRNVIYRSGAVPDFPYSSLDSENPEDLWDALGAQRGEGMDNLAIPHNGNVSNGLMYANTTYEGGVITDDYVRQRLANEPISEVFQVKGASETHPELSPEDSFADFGIYDQALSASGGKPLSKGSYARDALRSGIEMSHREGFNPYQFGFIGSSDGHNSSSPVEEDNYHGKLPVLDGSAGIRLAETLLLPDAQNRGGLWFAMGLAGVWAQENTRASLFDAMRRKETYATSGPRMALRFFAGSALGIYDIDAVDAIERAYAEGVPMGGALEAGADGESPWFWVLAQKDPDGANLDRLQIIKGWVDATGASHEAVIDVAASEGRQRDGSGSYQPVGNTVDVADASYVNSIGAVQLSVAWQDPNFDPDQQAFYYARVLEIPTPRSTTYDAKSLGLEAPDPTSVQERAISSAIWYSP